MDCSEGDGEDDQDNSCDDSDSGEGGEESDDEEPEGVKKAAAAMAVGVGNLSDPEMCQVKSPTLVTLLLLSGRLRSTMSASSCAPLIPPMFRRSTHVASTAVLGSPFVFLRVCLDRIQTIRV